MSNSKNVISLTDTISRQFYRITDLLRGTLSSEQIRDLLMAISFLKAIAELQESRDLREPIDKFLNIPSEADWHIILTAPNYQTLLRAWYAFEAHHQNLDFKQVFTSLGLLNLELSPTLCAEIIHIVESISGYSLFEYLSCLTQEHMGQHRTPSSLTDLLIDIAAPISGASVYDPACGEGGLLISAFKRKSGKARLEVFGQDVSLRAIAIARMALALHGIAPSSVAVGDTLLEPNFIIRNTLQRFDYVVSELPIGVQLSRNQQIELMQDKYQQFLYGIPRVSSEFAFIQHALTSLNESGRAVIATAPRVLFVTGNDGEIRRRIIENDLLEAVISLPSGILNVTMVPPVILVLSKNKPVEMRGRVQFILADTEYEENGRRERILSASSHKKIIQALTDRQERQRFSYIASISEIAERDFNLIPAQYLPLFNMKSFLGGDFVPCRLSDISEIMPGTHLTPQERESGDTPVIQGRNLTIQGLKLDDLDRISIIEQTGRKVYVQSGDVLIQRIGNRPTAFLVPPELSGVLAVDTVHIIRLNDTHNKLGRYLTEFFNSEKGQTYLSTVLRGAVVPSLNLSELRKLIIPIPKDAVTNLLDFIHQAEQKLVERIRSARNLRSQLFAIEDAEKVNVHLQRLSIEAKVLDESIIQTDDLSFRVRNFYPYPLAYTYRTLDAIHNVAQLYTEQLRVAENLLAFLGSIGLSITAHLRKNFESTDNPLSSERLRSYWQNGVTPGHWRDIARHCASLLRNEQRFALAYSYGSGWFKGSGTKQSEFAKRLDELVERKNDFKHDRGPKNDYDYRVACDNLNSALTEIFHGLAFLVQYPIRQVQDLDQDWRSGQISIQTLVYTGDHPGLRQETVFYPSWLPKQHIYLELNYDNWVPLYPLISVQYCPDCKTSETYFLDFWNPDRNRTMLKSFERGHVHEKGGIAFQVSADMQHWLATTFKPVSTS